VLGFFGFGVVCGVFGLSGLWLRASLAMTGRIAGFGFSAMRLPWCCNGLLRFARNDGACWGFGFGVVCGFWFFGVMATRFARDDGRIAGFRQREFCKF